MAARCSIPELVPLTSRLQLVLRFVTCMPFRRPHRLDMDTHSTLHEQFTIYLRDAFRLPIRPRRLLAGIGTRSVAGSSEVSW